MLNFTDLLTCQKWASIHENPLRDETHSLTISALILLNARSRRCNETSGKDTITKVYLCIHSVNFVQRTHTHLINYVGFKVLAAVATSLPVKIEVY
jgi:hypothetical protein